MAGLLASVAFLVKAVVFRLLLNQLRVCLDEVARLHLDLCATREIAQLGDMAPNPFIDDMRAHMHAFGVKLIGLLGPMFDEMTDFVYHFLRKWPGH